MARKKNYPGSIRDRGDYFQVRLCVTRAKNESKYHTFRVDGADRVEAEAFARTNYNELLGGRGEQPPIDHRQDAEPFSSLLKRFKDSELPLRAVNTRKVYTISMAALRRFFVVERGDPDVQSIGRGQIQSFLLLAPGPPAKRNREADPRLGPNAREGPCDGTQPLRVR